MSRYEDDICIRLTEEQSDKVNKMIAAYLEENGQLKSQSTVAKFVYTAGKTDYKEWTYINAGSGTGSSLVNYWLKTGDQNQTKYNKQHEKSGQQVDWNNNYICKIKAWGSADEHDTRYSGVTPLNLLSHDQIASIIDAVTKSSGSYVDNDWAYAISGESGNGNEVTTIDIRDRRIDDPNTPLVIAGSAVIGQPEDVEERAKFTVMGETEGQDGTVFGRLVDVFGEGTDNINKWGHQIPNENYPKVYMNRGEDRFNGEDWVDGYSLTPNSIGQKRTIIQNAEGEDTVQIEEGANYGLGWGTVEATKEIVSHTTISADHGMIIEDGHGDEKDKGIYKTFVKDASGQVTSMYFSSEGAETHPTGNYALNIKHDGAKVQGHSIITDEEDKNIFYIKQDNSIVYPKAETKTLETYENDVIDGCWFCKDGESGNPTTQDSYYKHWCIQKDGEETYVIDKWPGFLYHLSSKDVEIICSTETDLYIYTTATVTETETIKTEYCFVNNNGTISLQEVEKKDEKEGNSYFQYDNKYYVRTNIPVNVHYIPGEDETSGEQRIVVITPISGGYIVKADVAERIVPELHKVYELKEDYKEEREISGSGIVEREVEEGTTLYEGYIYWDGSYFRQVASITDDEVINYKYNDGYGSLTVGTRTNNMKTTDTIGRHSLEVGTSNEATGDNAIALGTGNKAIADNTLAMGSNSQAKKLNAIALGNSSTANGEASTAENHSTTGDNAKYAHSENEATANGMGSHAEGKSTASAQYAHAEGEGSTASSQAAHAEGSSSIVEGETAIGAHAEGNSHIKNSKYSHAEGASSIDSTSEAVHTEGKASATGTNSEAAHAEGKATVSAKYAHAEGEGKATGQDSHAEGTSTANGVCSHAEGAGNTSTSDNTHTEGSGNTAVGVNAHAEGSENSTNGKNAHVEGSGNKANKDNAHAGGSGTIAEGINSFTGGLSTHTTGAQSVAFGNGTEATNENAVAFGSATHATGISAIAGGSGTTAEGAQAVALGSSTTAKGINAFAIGSGNNANANNSVALGSSNTTDQPNQVLMGAQAKTTREISDNIKETDSESSNKQIIFGIGNVSDNLFDVTTDGYGYIKKGLEVVGKSDLDEKVTIGKNADGHEELALEVKGHSQFDNQVLIKDDTNEGCFGLKVEGASKFVKNAEFDANVTTGGDLTVGGEIYNKRIPQDLYEEITIEGTTYLNQFADKFFVNSSIATSTAFFRGNYSPKDYAFEKVSEEPTTGTIHYKEDADLAYWYTKWDEEAEDYKVKVGDYCKIKTKDGFDYYKLAGRYTNSDEDIQKIITWLNSQVKYKDKEVVGVYILPEKPDEGDEDKLHYVVKEGKYYFYENNAWVWIDRPNANDYCHVQIWEHKTNVEPNVLFADIYDADGNEEVVALDETGDPYENICYRFKYVSIPDPQTLTPKNPTWMEEYQLNNSGFTQAQWNAINSGITYSWIVQTDTAIAAEETAREEAIKAVYKYYGTYDNSVGNGTKPVYLEKTTDGVRIKECDNVVEGNIKVTSQASSWIMTALKNSDNTYTFAPSNKTLNSNNKTLLWVDSGILKECTGSLGSNNKFLYLSNGQFTESDYSIDMNESGDYSSLVVYNSADKTLEGHSKLSLPTNLEQNEIIATEEFIDRQGFALASDVASTYLAKEDAEKTYEKIGVAKGLVDALREEIDIDNYATKDSIKDFVTESTVDSKDTAIKTWATNNFVSKTNNYATESYVTTALKSYSLTTDIENTYAKKGDYVTKTEIAAYAKLSDVPNKIAIGSFHQDRSFDNWGLAIAEYKVVDGENWTYIYISVAEASSGDDCAVRFYNQTDIPWNYTYYDFLSYGPTNVSISEWKISHTQHSVATFTLTCKQNGLIIIRLKKD